MTYSARARWGALTTLLAVFVAGFLPCGCDSGSGPGSTSGSSHCGESNPGVQVSAATSPCCCVARPEPGPTTTRTQPTSTTVLAFVPLAVPVRPAWRPWLSAPPSGPFTESIAPSPPLVLRI